MKCPCCGKELNPETNTEKCPKSLYFHGLHPVAVMPVIEEKSFVPEGEIWFVDPVKGLLGAITNVKVPK